MMVMILAINNDNTDAIMIVFMIVILITILVINIFTVLHISVPAKSSAPPGTKAGNLEKRNYKLLLSMKKQ